MRFVLLVAFLPLAAACTDSRVNSNNASPEAAILEPAPDATSPLGESVSFRGTVDDGVTASSDLEVSWSSSVDGVLLEESPDDEGSTVFSTDELRAGEHTITLRVVDPQGATGTDAITITIEEAEVENTAPTCAITAPEDDAELTEGDTVVLEGAASDAQSEPTELLASWSSSEDGALGSSSPSSSGAIALPISTLSAGTHVITLDVADSEDLNCSEFIVVTVTPDNFPPSIGAPSVAPNQLFTTSTATCIAPTPSDVEGDVVDVELRWLVGGLDAGILGDTLNAPFFAKGDTVACTATPSDATGTGTPMTSPAVVVSDSPPTAPAVSIAPAAPVEAADELVCSVSAVSTDPDNEAVTYSMAWSYGGAPYTGATSQNTLPGDTVDATNVAAGSWICTVTPTAASVAGPTGSATVTVAPPTPGGKLVFVTSTTQNGAMGGTGGADAICQGRASAAGLSGTFNAWISGGSSSSAPASRFTRSTSLPYVRTDGAVVANDWADLTDGTLQNPINIDEFGALQGGSFAWSYTQTDGTKGLFGNSSEDCYGGDCHCNNWSITATQGSPTPGSAVSQLNAVNDDWTDYSFGNFCGSGYRLKCFEQ